MTERKTVTVFISSPGDVASERRRVVLVVNRLQQEFGRFLTLRPVLWETEPMLATGHFQDLIEPLPGACDIVVAILWSRLGTPLPEHTARREYKGLDGRVPVTGTEWEIEQALEARQTQGQPDLLVYRNQGRPQAIGSRSDDFRDFASQMDALKAFWTRHFVDPEGRGFKLGYNDFSDADDFEAKLESHLRALLRQRLPEHTGEGKADAGLSWYQGSPFRGLRAFDVEHAPIFFGRWPARAAVIDGLTAGADAGRAFMLVLGASGTGKSSLVRAGVLPLLETPGVYAGIGAWRHCIVTPAGRGAAEGGDVFDRLARALLETRQALPEIATHYDATRLAARLRDGGGADIIEMALRQIAERERLPARPDAPPPARLVLVVDQLEEIFTDAKAFPREVLTRFAGLLRSLAQSGVVWVLATLRSDFFHRLAEVPDLLALSAGPGQVHLAPADGADLEQIIRLPAQAAGLSFESHPETRAGLDTVLREAAAGQDALPLLEFTLDELYRRDVDEHGRSVLTFESYDALGGLEGAIAGRAEAACAALGPDRAADVDGVLLALAGLDQGEGTTKAEDQAEDQATLRVVAGADLARTPARAAVVEALVSARLLVSDAAGAAPDAEGATTARLAHEALLRRWPRYKALLAREQAFLKARGRVMQALGVWLDQGRDPARLLPDGVALAEAENLLATRRDDLEAAAIGYIEASSKAARVRRDRRLRQTRMVAALMLLLAGLSLGLGLWALDQRDTALANGVEAERQREVAEQNAAEAGRQALEARRSQVLFFTEKAESLLKDGQPEKALAIAVEALPKNPEMAQIYENTFTGISKFLADSGCAGTLVRKNSNSLYSASFDPLGNKIIAVYLDNTADIIDYHSGSVVNTLQGSDGIIYATSFNHSGELVATASSDGTIRMWRASNGTKVMTHKNHPNMFDLKLFRSDIFSSTRDWMVTLLDDKTAMISDTWTGTDVSVLRGHKATLTTAIFNPSGDKVVTGSEDGTARVWDAETGTETVVFRSHTDGIYSAVFSSSGDFVATSSADNSVRIWDVQTGAEVAVIHAKYSRIRNIRFSPSDEWLVTASESNQTMQIWDASSGANLSISGHENIMSFGDFSPSGTQIIAILNDNTASLLHLPTGTELINLKGHHGAINSAKFSPSGHWIVTGSDDGTVRIWNASNGTQVSELRAHATQEVVSAEFSPSGDGVFAILDSGTARIWSFPACGFPIPLSSNRPLPLSSADFLAFSSTSQSLIIGSKLGQALVWNLEAGAPVWGSTGTVLSLSDKYLVTASGGNEVTIWDPAREIEVAVLRGHTAWPNSASLSPFKNRIVTASDDHTARLWNTSTGAQIAVLDGHQDRVRSAMFSPSGNRVVTASDDGTARIWDAESGAQLAVLRGHLGQINSAVFSPSGDRVLTSSIDATARIWDTATGAEVAVLSGHDDEVISAAFSSSGDLVLTASGDGNAWVWNAVTGTEKTKLGPHFGSIKSAAFSPSGDRVVTASGDNRSRIWDTETGAELAVLEGHRGSVVSAAFSYSGDRVVTASDDKTARVWNALNGELIVVLRNDKSALDTATFNPSGNRVFTASSNGVAQVWDAEDGHMLSEIDYSLGQVTSIKFDPSGDRVVAGFADGVVRLIHSLTGGEVTVFQGHEDSVSASNFDFSGDRLLTGSQTGMARVWDAKTGAEIAIMEGHYGSIEAAVFSPSGEQVLTASDDHTARVWDAATGQQKIVLRGHRGPVNIVIPIPMANKIVTGSEDGTMRLWNGSTGQENLALGDLPGNPIFISFNERDRALNVIFSNGSAAVFDADTFDVIAGFEGPENSLGLLSFNPSGDQLVVPGFHVRVDYLGSDGERHLDEGSTEEPHDNRVPVSATWLPSEKNALNFRMLSIDTGGPIMFKGPASSFQAAAVEAVAFSPTGQYFAGISRVGVGWVWVVPSVGVYSRLAPVERLTRKDREALGLSIDAPHLWAPDADRCDVLSASIFAPYRSVVKGLSYSASFRDTLEQAVFACKASVDASPEEARFHYQLGHALDATGDAGGAIAAYRRAADLDYPPAQSALAEKLKEAANPEWHAIVDGYRKSAAGGFDLAKHSLGWLYWNGEGVAQDRGEAVGLWEECGDAGVPECHSSLAWLNEYDRGGPVGQDLEMAMVHHALAARLYEDLGYEDEADYHAARRGTLARLLSPASLKAMWPFVRDWQPRKPAGLVHRNN